MCVCVFQIVGSFILSVLIIFIFDVIITHVYFSSLNVFIMSHHEVLILQNSKYLMSEKQYHFIYTPNLFVVKDFVGNYSQSLSYIMAVSFNCYISK